MEDKKTIKLDLNGIGYLGELHERIRIAFDFPEWYGANWNAFKDLLFTECDADELIICGENSLSEQFDKHIDIMHNILIDFAKECNEDAKVYNNCKPFSFTIID